MTRSQAFMIAACVLLVAGEVATAHSTIRAGLFFGLAMLTFLFAGYLLSHEDW